MKCHAAKIGEVICVAVFAFLGLQPAHAGCELVTATHSAPTRVKAVQTSQALALQSAYNVQRSRGWSRTPGRRRSFLEGSSAERRAAKGEDPTRHRHCPVLYDVLPRRRRAVRLHHWLKRVRPVAGRTSLARCSARFGGPNHFSIVSAETRCHDAHRARASP